MDISNDTDNHKTLEQIRIRMLYEHIYEGVLGYYIWIASLAISLFFAGSSVHGILIWFSLASISRVFIMIMIKSLFSQSAIEFPKKWENYMVVASFFEGLVISVGTVVLINLELQSFAYISFAIIMVTAFISVMILVASTPTHIAWVLALMLPVTFKNLTYDDPFHWIIAGVTLASIPVSIVIGKKYHSAFIDLLKLRFENAELLKSTQFEKQLAEKANVQKTRFLASASHDLRQPIQALELFSDALTNELDKPLQIELMAKMKESTASINSLLYSLLDISRLDAGTIKVEKQGIYAEHIIQKILTILEPQIKSKQLKIDFNVDKCPVFSDALLLERILQNLIGNAIKYTNSGTISILCNTHNDKVQISIIDTGIGIAKNNIENIFDEFYQVDNIERDKTKGLGLGLSIVKRTCELLNHDISIQSEESVGSNFTLILDKAENVITKLVEDIPKTSKQQNATVLVIDDETIILEGMQKMLQPWGYSVLIAESLIEAKKILSESKIMIDIVISDYHLHDTKTGTEAIKSIRNILKKDNLPAIIITGDTGPKDLKDITNNKDFHLLHKPVEPIRLRTLMQYLLKKG